MEAFLLVAAVVVPVLVLAVLGLAYAYGLYKEATAKKDLQTSWTNKPPNG